MTSVISQVLRGNKEAKVIEILLENYKEWLTPSEISEMIDINENWINDYLQYLIEMDVVSESYGENMKKIYQIRRRNPIASGFFILEYLIVTSALDKKIKEADELEKSKN